MRRTEKLTGILLGSSLLFWAAMGLTQAPAIDPVRAAVAALNAFVGILFLIRIPQKRSGSLTTAAACLPSVLVAGVVMKLAPDPSSWPVAAQALFVAGAALTVVAFSMLGRSFAILPAVRRVVVRGPYRLLRHPAYLGELMMVATCALAVPSILTAALAGAALPLLLIRIIAEERVLRSEQAYREYSEAVGWRLLPGIW